MFLPNVIKIDPYDFELYRFKVGAFLRHSVDDTNVSNICKKIINVFVILSAVIIFNKLHMK